MFDIWGHDAKIRLKVPKAFLYNVSGAVVRYINLFVSQILTKFKLKHLNWRMHWLNVGGHS